VHFVDAFFTWHQRHHVTGVEILHVPSLIVSALLIWELDGRPIESPLIRDMQSVAPVWIWIIVVAGVAITLFMSLVNNHRRLHRWMLGAAASWWFTATFLVWHNGLTLLSFLNAMIYLFIALSAWWRIVEMAMRDRAKRDE
jgi:hypothetical protein